MTNEKIFLSNCLPKKKKYFLRRKDIIRITNQSYFKKNLIFYFCKIAFSKQVLRENDYEIKKIMDLLETNKNYSFDNFILTSEILCYLEKSSKLFPLNVISEKLLTQKDLLKYYKKKKRNQRQFNKFKNFFFLTKFLINKKKKFSTFTKIQVNGSKLFI